MLDLDDLLLEKPYELSSTEKFKYLLPRLNDLTAWHRDRNEAYRRFLEANSLSGPAISMETLPFLPAGIFKKIALNSLPKEKTQLIQSSATSSGQPSQIFVDREMAELQKSCLQQIFDSFIGEGKRPYIIFDAPQSIRGRGGLSARGAAIMGLMPYASQIHFVMEMEGNKLRLNWDKFRCAVRKIADEGERFLAYGFTYILYQCHAEMQERNWKTDIPHLTGKLIHSGGWKNLTDIAVSADIFQKVVSSPWNLNPNAVIDFYGLVEQVGVIYPQCSEGLRHAPYYADFFIRDPVSLEALGIGETGMLQLISLLARGSPNHSILTDDLAILELEDGCPCGRRGKAFRLIGRAPKVEVRGCSDLYGKEEKGAS